MRAAVEHPREAERLASLRRLRLLDTDAEERFDRLTRLTSLVLGTPMALVSLLDEHRQWFKSRAGVGLTETPREVSFCAHAIVHDAVTPFVVEDTHDDDRFADNPFVVHDPNVRFYAGQALHGPDGLPVGTLCALDRRPRHLDPWQVDALQQIAALVEQELVRVSEAELVTALEQSERHKSLILDTLDEGVVLQDHEGNYLETNSAVLRILGMTPEQLADRTPTDPRWRRVHADGRPADQDPSPADVALRTGAPVMGEVIGIVDGAARRRWLRVNARPISDEHGATTHVLTAIADVTDDHLVRRMLDTTLEAAPVGLAVLDSRRHVVRCNSAFATQAGRDASLIVGGDIVDLLRPDHRDAAIRAGEMVRTGTDMGELEQCVARPDGTEMWVTTRVVAVPGADPPMAVAATYDVTERRRMMLELSRYEHLFEHTNDVMLVIDAQGAVLFASPSVERVLGYSPDYRPAGGVLSLIHPDDLEQTATELLAVVAGTRESSPFTTRVLDASGTWRYIECVAANLLGTTEVNGILITVRDATDRVLLAQALAHRAAHDPLTDLPNRELLEERLGRALARHERAGTRVAVAFVDLDGFKGVNDALGHAIGDALLCDVAEALRSSLRLGDTAARVGGDEFVLLIDPAADHEDACRTVERVREAVLEQQPPVGQVRIGASFGIALSEPYDSPTSILKRADDALYRAKQRHDSSIEVA